jgi:hypothetical protein
VCQRLADAFREGKAVTMMEGSYGKFRKTAFQWGIKQDERLAGDGRNGLSVITKIGFKPNQKTEKENQYGTAN